MVTRILFDPRRDLPTGGGLDSTAVIVQATPTGIREDGSIVILPTTLSFPIDSADDLFQLVPTTASWKWRLVVRDAASSAVLQQRTVLVPDQASITYQALVDVDPASLGNTASTARNWDATFGQILELMAGIVAGELNDNAVASLIATPASATATVLAASLSATYLQFKQAAKTPDLLIVGTITRDANGVISTAAVVWPDGTVGTFTTSSVDATGAINGYSITYGSPATKTYTQPTITRDSTGAATTVPQITVA